MQRVKSGVAGMCVPDDRHGARPSLADTQRPLSTVFSGRITHTIQGIVLCTRRGSTVHYKGGQCSTGKYHRSPPSPIHRCLTSHHTKMAFTEARMVLEADAWTSPGLQRPEYGLSLTIFAYDSYRIFTVSMIRHRVCAIGCCSDIFAHSSISLPSTSDTSS